MRRSSFFASSLVLPRRLCNLVGSFSLCGTGRKSCQQGLVSLQPYLLSSPSLARRLSLLLPRADLGPLAFFYLLTPIAGAFSGLIAYGSQKNLEGSHGNKSWQWLFIIEGVISVGWGILTLLVLPKNPETVAKNGSWLFRGQRERELILERTKTRSVRFFLTPLLSKCRG